MIGRQRLMLEKPFITIVSVVKNGATYLRQSLPVILGQDIPFPFEVIYIDSGSTDGSVELLKDHARKVNHLCYHQIRPEEFHHAKTRNWGMKQGKGDLVVFLGGDAVPVDSGWLRKLTAPVIEQASDRVVAAYGKQIPRKDADINNYCRMTFNYGDHFLIKGKDTNHLSRKEMYFFSSVNCCINRKNFPDFQFAEHLPVNEDVTLSYKIIENGFRIAYCPDAAVVHSHNFGYVEILKRYFDNAVTYERIGIFNGCEASIQGDGKKFLRHSLEILSQRERQDWIKFVFFLLYAGAGVKLGQNCKYLPKFIARKLSQYGTV